MRNTAAILYYKPKLIQNCMSMVMVIVVLTNSDNVQSAKTSWSALAEIEFLSNSDSSRVAIPTKAGIREPASATTDISTNRFSETLIFRPRYTLGLADRLSLFAVTSPQYGDSFTWGDTYVGIAMAPQSVSTQLYFRVGRFSSPYKLLQNEFSSDFATIVEDNRDWLYSYPRDVEFNGLSIGQIPNYHSSSWQISSQFASTRDVDVSKIGITWTRGSSDWQSDPFVLDVSRQATRFFEKSFIGFGVEVRGDRSPNKLETDEISVFGGIRIHWKPRYYGLELPSSDFNENNYELLKREATRASEYVRLTGERFAGQRAWIEFNADKNHLKAKINDKSFKSFLLSKLLDMIEVPKKLVPPYVWGRNNGIQALIEHRDTDKFCTRCISSTSSLEIEMFSELYRSKWVLGMAYLSMNQSRVSQRSLWIGYRWHSRSGLRAGINLESIRNQMRKYESRVVGSLSYSFGPDTGRL